MAVDFRSFNCLPEHQGPAFQTWSRILQTATMSSASPTSPLLSPKSYANLESSFPKLIPSEEFIPFDSTNNVCPKKRSNSTFSTDMTSQGRATYEGSDGLTSFGEGTHDIIEVTYAPWKKKCYPENAYGLHLEVKDFYEYMSPTLEEAFMRKSVVQRISNLITSIWPAAKVEVFGSYKTNLYLPTSDIDIVVFGKWEKLPLWTLEKALVNEEIADQSTIKVLDKASVPIVKLTDKKSNIKVDISFNMETAVKGAELIQEFLREYKVLPQLFLLLKHFLVMRDLNEVFTGGISSYCLMLLTVSFLQMHPRQESKLPNANLGVLLLEFFELYGRNFNYQRTGIKLRNGGCYCSKDEIMREMVEGQFPSLLCIEDPVSKVIDIGKSSFGIMRVKEAFEYAYNVLESALRNKHYFKINPYSTYLSRIIQVSPEIMQCRRRVKENFRLPKQDALATISSQSHTPSLDAKGSEIDIVNAEDFPPLQTANPLPQQTDPPTAKNVNIENSEVKHGKAAAHTSTLYSYVGSDSKARDLPVKVTLNSDNIDDGAKTMVAIPDVAKPKADKDLELLQKEYTENDYKSEKLSECESPNEDLLDDFVLDPYISWGDMCDESLAEDEDFANTKERTLTAEALIGSGGPSAWSSDEGPLHSHRKPKRPTTLTTRHVHCAPSIETKGSEKARSYQRRSRTRSPCEGIGEQDLASARQARQLIISSPEKPIVKQEKWAREDLKHGSRDHKNSDHMRTGNDENSKEQRFIARKDSKEHHSDFGTSLKHGLEQVPFVPRDHHNHKHGAGHKRRNRRDGKPF